MRGRRAKSIPAAAYPSARLVAYRQYAIGTGSGTVIADAGRREYQQGKRAVVEARQAKAIPELPAPRRSHIAKASEATERWEQALRSVRRNIDRIEAALGVRAWNEATCVAELADWLQLSRSVVRDAMNAVLRERRPGGARG